MPFAIRYLPFTSCQSPFAFTTRYSLFAIRCRFTSRQSLIAAVSGLAGASPSHFRSRPPSRVPRPFPFLSRVPCH
ncbi:MAG: hypothetical protein OGMRLDGQ_002746, partial [Candidatus Fervidibacter sp.]